MRRSLLPAITLSLAAVLVAPTAPPADEAPATPVPATSNTDVEATPASVTASAEETPCLDAPLHPFTDLSRTSPHARAVDCLVLLDIARGRHIDRFGPTDELRRDQLATMMVNALETAGAALPAPDEPHFEDLDGNVHRDAIEALAHAGIVQGRAGDRYTPAARVPRGQMAAFLVRSYEYVTGDEVHGEPGRFDDVEGHTHQEDIEALAELGITEGRTETSFAPNEPTPRAEIATFVVRLLQTLPGAMATGGADFQTRIDALPGSLRTTMTGSSWRSGCPVELDRLRLLSLTHHDFDGQARWGHLVVHRDVAEDLADVFRALYDEGFPVHRMRIVDRYGADDDRSMADNNTHAFNCRQITGGNSFSQHSYGTALDINPVQNPYVRNGVVLPEQGREYLDRSDVRPGMIVRPDVVTDAFDALGWTWGGDWNSLKDYQHFER